MTIAAQTGRGEPMAPIVNIDSDPRRPPAVAGPNGASLMTVSLVIPTRNEARNLGYVLEQVPDCVDEIILVTFPPGISRWLGQDLPHRLQKRFDLPVTHLVAAAPAVSRAG